ncbi:hypothetical protein AB0L99_00680 [Streptomyces sp. NPDC051954]|uniref:hypothetical protein n=1 Tax=unclassified Streptomyces TaxID=2593676 RepID=UPI00342BD6AE
MRRITLWFTATLAVAALLFAHQLNLSGSGAKGGEDHDEAPVATAPSSPGSTPSAQPTDEAKSGDDTPGDGEHVGKPGENK